MAAFLSNIDVSIVLNTFPTLIPLDLSLTGYIGFVEFAGLSFKLEIGFTREKQSFWDDLPQDTFHWKNAYIVCDPKLGSVLSASVEMVQNKLSQASSFGAFLQDFKLIIEESIIRSQNAGLLSSSQSYVISQGYYSRILSELEAVGWQTVTKINVDMNRITLNISDSGSRSHLLEIEITRDYPVSTPNCHISLPSKADLPWQPSNTLKDIVAFFTVQLEKYQELWNVLDDLDENTSILEPSIPMRSDIIRRVDIGKHSSIRLEVNVNNPNSVPSMTFLGPDAIVKQLKERLSSRIHEWDYKKMLRLNLEQVFEMEFPRKSSLQSSDNQAACAICYSYSLGPEIPDRPCDNPTCARPFHSACLFDWLSAVQTASRIVPAILWGKCPYCDHKISAKNPHSR